MIYKLTWIFLLLAGETPIASHGTVDREWYRSQESCMTAGRERVLRAADYARGHWGLDWKQEIKVGFTCPVVGIEA